MITVAIRLRSVDRADLLDRTADWYKSSWKQESVTLHEFHYRFQIRSLALSFISSVAGIIPPLDIDQIIYRTGP